MTSRDESRSSARLGFRQINQRMREVHRLQERERPASWEEARAYLKNPHGRYPPERLHAIFEQSGHDREIADYLASNPACWPKTAIGLYKMYGRDKEFVCRMVRSQGVFSPEGVLDAELARLVFEDHVRHGPDEAYPVLTRKILKSIAATVETLKRIAGIARSLLDDQGRPGKSRRAAQMLVNPQELLLTTNPSSSAATIMIEGCPPAAESRQDRGYRISYNLLGDRRSSRRISLLENKKPTASILFPFNSSSSLLLEPEALWLLKDLTNPEALRLSGAGMRELLLAPAN